MHLLNLDKRIKDIESFYIVSTMYIIGTIGAIIINAIMLNKFIGNGFIYSELIKSALFHVLKLATPFSEVILCPVSLK